MRCRYLVTLGKYPTCNSEAGEGLQRTTACVLLCTAHLIYHSKYQPFTLDEMRPLRQPVHGTYVGSCIQLRMCSFMYGTWPDQLLEKVGKLGGKAVSCT